MKTHTLLRRLLPVAALCLAVAPALVAAPPGNDSFATPLTYSGLSMAVTTTEATGEPGEPDHLPGGGSTTPLHSVWWKFTAPVSGIYQIDTMGSSFDTVLSIYTGSSLTTLTRLRMDDEGGGSSTSLIKIYLTKGTTYRIAVDGYNGHSGNAILQIKVLRYFSALSWQAHIYDSTLAVSPQNTGLITLTTASSGTITGKCLLGGKSWPFTAAMDLNGAFAASVPRTGLTPLTLTGSSSSTVFMLPEGFSCIGTTQINLVMTDLSVSSAAARPVGAGDNAMKAIFPSVAAWSSSNPCPRAGRYNLTILPVTPNDGYSTCSFTISSTGTCAGGGTMGDGSPFTFSVPLLNPNGPFSSIGTSGVLCISPVLYSGAGLLAGFLPIDASTTPALITNNVIWVRPQSKPGVLPFKNGFYYSTNSMGSRYTAPLANTRIDTAFDPAGACAITVNDSGAGSFSQGLTLSLLNKFSYTPPNSHLASLSITTSTGALSGSARFTGETKSRSVKGVFVAHPSLSGHGFYGMMAGPNGYSTMTLRP